MFLQFGFILLWLLLEGGRELFVVTLTFDSRLSVYLPRRFEWYATK
jgi:hypothetical protein